MIPKLSFDDGPVLLDGGMGQELCARIGGMLEPFGQARF